jgi:predicted DNA-binding protein
MKKTNTRGPVQLMLKLDILETLEKESKRTGLNKSVIVNKALEGYLVKLQLKYPSLSDLK